MHCLKNFKLKFGSSRRAVNDQSANVIRTNMSSSRPERNAGAALLRVQKEFGNISLPDTCELVFEDANNLLNFGVVISPDDGYYCGGKFHFTVSINRHYPYEPPKVKCETPIFHPNIDGEGNVCLNILRDEWKPVLTLENIINALLHLLYEPNHEDALNQEAADLLVSDPELFKQKLKIQN